MTGWAGGADGLDDRQRVSLGRSLLRWREHHGGGSAAPGAAAETGSAVAEPGTGPGVRLVDMELLRAGRTGLVDVVAEMDGRLAHAVLGLHRPGDDLHVLGTVEEPALGVVEDDEGLAVVVDALHDADAARLLLAAVAGDRVASPHDAPSRPETRPRVGGPGRPAASVVTLLHDDAETTTLGIDRRFTLSVFPWLRRGSHPGAALLAGLDESGFNHLAAPVAFWRRAGRDLGVVQELLAGAAGGWALALTSLRDLFASGMSPDVAGGDFAPEALALGTMAARMHIALDRAFGRRPGDVRAWTDAIEKELSAVAPALLDAPPAGRTDATLREALALLRSSDLHPPAIRTHGDFHLGRTARTDHGWVLADCMPGGAEPETGEPVFRSPLADVADLCWSLRHAAVVAATERGPVTARSRLSELAEAWDARNRHAFLAAYLATPGIGSLVPPDRRVVRRLLAAFEAARAVRRPAALGPVA